MIDRVPAVSCEDCGRSWNSATLVEGLRLVGSCPRCGGALTFRDAEATAAGSPVPAAGRDARAPHLVLGIPRR
jgi:hypothetical protein